MRTSRSSIFSFETFDAGSPGLPDFLKVAIVVVCVVAAGEIAARLLLEPIGDYWKYWSPAAAAKFETYRADARRGAVPRLVVVGDSTGARDIDPAKFVDNGSAYNLSWPANFPLAFRDCTLPLLHAGSAPAVVVASFTPGAFTDSPRVRRFEESILSSTYCRELRGERTPIDYLYLPRLRPALPFARSWWTGRHLPRMADRGFMPIQGHVSDAEPEEAGASDAVSAERFSALAALFQASRTDGFQAIVVVPPHWGLSPARLRSEQAYVDRLRASGFRYLDLREPPFLTARHFADHFHLNREGAEVYSTHLAQALTGASQASTE